jgi:hypothetical protein
MLAIRSLMGVAFGRRQYLLRKPICREGTLPFIGLIQEILTESSKGISEAKHQSIKAEGKEEQLDDHQSSNHPCILTIEAKKSSDQNRKGQQDEQRFQG